MTDPASGGGRPEPALRLPRLEPAPLRDPRHGVYGITTAAELVGMGPQTLRAYERHGLLEPARTQGGTRRYSDEDLARLRRIGELLGAGLNLAGVSAVLGLEHDNTRLRNENRRLRRRRARRAAGADESRPG